MHDTPPSLQVGEFIVVWGHDPPPAAVLVPYIVMWSMFGVHAGLRLIALSSPGSLPLWESTAWVEAGYSLLSWLAKLYVFWTAFTFRYGSDYLVFVSVLWACLVFMALSLLLQQGYVFYVRRGAHVRVAMPY